MEPSPHLEQLKTLSREMPKLIEMVKHINGNGNIEYDTNGEGDFKGYGIFNNGCVAIQRVFMSKDTIIPEHSHTEREYVITYKGSYELNRGGVKTTLMVGDSMYFEPNEPHSGVILEDTWIVSITIPSGEGYPNAR